MSSTARQQSILPIDIYARVSKKKPSNKKQERERERSPEDQVATCRAVLADRGLPEGGTFIDPGRSAWNPRVKRDDWDALMGRMERGESGGVIVFDLERYSRQPDDAERLIKLATRGLLILDSEQVYDLATASGKKGFRDAIAAGAYYSDRHSTRVRRGLDAKARKGEVAYSRRAFGFEDGSHEEDAPPPVPHPIEGPILQEMTARLLKGESQLALMADLARRGITTSYGKPWTWTGLRAVLLRPLNAGLVEHNGEIVAKIRSDDYQPLISRDDYDKLVAMFAARRRGRPASVYLCSGIASCSLCGTLLHGRPRSEMRHYDDGEVKREYWCAYSNGGCGKIAIDQRALDGLARALVIRVLSDPEHAAQIEAAAAEHADEAGKLDAAITTAEELGRALADRLGREEITLDRYDAATGPLDRRLAALRAQRKALARPGEPVPAALSRQQWEARWVAADAAEHRRLLRLALRGKVLRVGPADMADRTNVTRRVTLADPS
jgi:DNA invertase Pin-like site-specific DNA recombinase